MNEKRIQHLTEAFASIISMMLGMIRAQGWRSLLNLPELWLTARYLRRLGQEFAALMADFKSGLLVLPPLAPAPCAVPPEQETAYAPSPETPRPASRDRQRPAVRRSPPAAYAEPDRPRAASSATALPHAHGQAAPRLRPSRFAMPKLPAGAIATARSCRTHPRQPEVELCPDCSVSVTIDRKRGATLRNMPPGAYPARVRTEPAAHRGEFGLHGILPALTTNRPPGRRPEVRR
jgi:hypothetical protein